MEPYFKLGEPHRLFRETLDQSRESRMSVRLEGSEVKTIRSNLTGGDRTNRSIEDEWDVQSLIYNGSNPLESTGTVHVGNISDERDSIGKDLQ